MIPEFPTFKKIELSDKNNISDFTSKFPSYSDFSFVSMWAWDIKGEMSYSQLNSNLVVKFTDYLTGEPFFSFLGTQRVNETVNSIFDYSKNIGVVPILKLIAEECIIELDVNKFMVTEDRDHFDYIYKIEELRDLSGGKFAKKRNQVALFLKNYPNSTVSTIDLKDKNVQGNITNLFLEWLKIKINEDAIFESHEEVAVSRLLLAIDELNLVGTGVFVHNKLEAFIINEISGSDYVVAHASKINRKFDGINSYLIKGNAQILSSYKKTYFNYEQDLGVENLRTAKARFRPCAFLKKYQVAQI